LGDGDSDLFNKGQKEGTFLINIKKSHEPLAGMHWYLVWIILWEREFKFV